MAIETMPIDGSIHARIALFTVIWMPIVFFAIVKIYSFVFTAIQSSSVNTSSTLFD